MRVSAVKRLQALAIKNALIAATLMQGASN
jgi:hypothetical protein